MPDRAQCWSIACRLTKWCSILRRLKSFSRGLCQFRTIRLTAMKKADLVKMFDLVNSEPVDALACIVHRAQSERRGRQLCERLKRADPQAIVQDRHSSRHRRAHYRARRYLSDAQGVLGQMLWRRRVAQTQIARQAEGRQKAMRQFGQVRNSRNPPLLPRSGSANE